MSKAGIVPHPPKNVSDLIVKQVLNGKSGRLVVPKSDEGKTGVRSFPLWVQDILFGHVWQRKNHFAFAEE
jgi:all-trans-retinol dehydrogenase (NAD+)